ncbi:hypothetical protein GCM10009863_33750 [Streptomyces axinellae]|uniref:Uncharacterized protein n=1 Tax=Streptomyces axinellae TaxID=552788 RepID=A0ABN3Q855_9ACTN
MGERVLTSAGGGALASVAVTVAAALAPVALAVAPTVVAARALALAPGRGCADQAAAADHGRLPGRNLKTIQPPGTRNEEALDVRGQEP